MTADFDGDAKADPTVYEEATATWQACISTRGYTMVSLTDFGGTGKIACAADFDGDGKADPAICQSATGEWTILLSTLGYATPLVLNQAEIGN